MTIFGKAARRGSSRLAMALAIGALGTVGIANSAPAVAQAAAQEHKRMPISEIGTLPNTQQASR